MGADGDLCVLLISHDEDNTSGRRGEGLLHALSLSFDYGTREREGGRKRKDFTIGRKGRRSLPRRIVENR
jgi:hypothetical protein